MSVPMPPRRDGMLNVTPEEVADARMATEDVELVRPDGTLTEAGQIYVADMRYMAQPIIRLTDALRNVAVAVRDTAPSGRIAVSKVERIIRNEIAAQRERG